MKKIFMLLLLPMLAGGYEYTKCFYYVNIHSAQPDGTLYYLSSKSYMSATLTDGQTGYTRVYDRETYVDGSRQETGYGLTVNQGSTTVFDVDNVLPVGQVTAPVFDEATGDWTDHSDLIMGNPYQNATFYEGAAYGDISRVYLDLYLDGGPVGAKDLYEWSIRFTDGNPIDSKYFKVDCHLQYEDGSTSGEVSGSAVPFTYSGQEDVLSDGVGLRPAKVWVRVWENDQLRTDWYGLDFYQQEGETSATGGNVYSIDQDDVLQAFMEEPEPDDPDPVDPTDPPDPTEPADPRPPVAGGDTSPEVATNYEAFRDAVESALDNRELSAEELRDAMREALAGNGLTSTNLQNATQNALENQGLSSEKIQDAVEYGVSKGNDQSEYWLQQIAYETRGIHNDMGSTQSMAGVEAGLGEINDRLDGEGSGYTGPVVPGGYSTTNSTYQGDLEGMNSGVLGRFVGGVEEKIRGMFTLNVPTISTISLYEYELPEFMGLSLPALRIDLESNPWIPKIRMIMLFSLYIWAFFTAFKTITWAYST